MTPPQIGIQVKFQYDSSIPLSAAEERQNYLSIQQLLLETSGGDKSPRFFEKWLADRQYRFRHQPINDILDCVSRFMKRDASLPASKVQDCLKKWLDDPKFKEDPLNRVVLANLKRILALFQSDSNREPASALQKILFTEAEALPQAIPAPIRSSNLIDKRKNWALGLELHNDSGALSTLDFIGIPVSSFAAEKNHITVRPNLEFPMGSWVGLFRLNAGAFEGRGIPGDDGGKGTGWRVGFDFGLVNPYSKSHDRSGLGIEITGIASHAGQVSGIPAPSPQVRLHLWRQSDFNFKIGSNFELGINAFFNNQETYLNFGKGETLSGPGGTTPYATAKDLFARNPFRWVGLSARYYFNGVPDRETINDLKKPFRPGEGAPKIGNLWTGMVINMNRREDVPAFANTQVLFGGFSVLGGEQSRAQFDTIGIGLTFYSIQDGYFIARNAQTRGEIWKRDNTWVLRSLMLAGDALMFGYNIYRAASAKSDPAVNQTNEEFLKNPGSVTDFSGRAGKINLALHSIELGLSVFDITGIAGEVTDKSLTKYWASSGIAAGLGALGFLLSGALTGSGCAKDGPGNAAILLRCGFPAQRDKYFKTNTEISPENMASIEKQYIFSTFASALASWGFSRLLQPLVLSTKPRSEVTAQSEVPAPKLSQPYINLAAGGNGLQLVIGGQF